MTSIISERAALIIIDLQKGIDDPVWGRRNNPEVEARTAALLQAWRDSRRPIVHVQHLSRESASPLRPGQAGCDFKDGFVPGPGETLIQKRTTNAFIDTGLEASLRDRGVTEVVVAGVLLHNSVDATVRMAANLGFDTWLVEDATASVDKIDRRGHHWPAEDVHALSLAHLDGEYARVETAEHILAAARVLVDEKSEA